MLPPTGRPQPGQTPPGRRPAPGAASLLSSQRVGHKANGACQAAEPGGSECCAADRRTDREQPLEESPRTVTGHNMPELFKSPFIIVQHRKLSGKGRRKCTSLQR